MLYPYNFETLNLIKETVKKGNLISFPTDTLFALSCDATNSDAIAKLFECKKRDQSKPLPILIKDLKTAHNIAVFDDLSLKLAKAFWPGGLTLVLPLKKISKISPLTKAKDGTIALRVPNYPISIEILEKVDVPLVGTSANFAGGKNLITPSTINEHFGDSISVIINKDIEHQIFKPSTIVKIYDNKINILREGIIDRSTIEKALSLQLKK